MKHLLPTDSIKSLGVSSPCEGFCVKALHKQHPTTHPPLMTATDVIIPLHDFCSSEASRCPGLSLSQAVALRRTTTSLKMTLLLAPTAMPAQSSELRVSGCVTFAQMTSQMGTLLPGVNPVTLGHASDAFILRLTCSASPTIGGPCSQICV